MREDAKLDDAARDAAVDDLLALVGAVDGILQAQATADTDYFARIAGMPFSAGQQGAIHDTVLKAYRWQYIVSGMTEPRFQKLLFGMVSAAQRARIESAFAPLAHAVPLQPAGPLPLQA